MADDRKTRKVDPAEALSITGNITPGGPVSAEDAAAIRAHSDLRRFYNMMSTNQDMESRKKTNR